MMPDTRTIKRLKVALLSLMLIVTQFIVFTQLIPAYASSYWDEQSTISPDGKVVIKELPHAKIRAEHISIPLHKQNETVANNPLGQTLATITITQNVVTTGTISGLGYDNVTPPDVQVAAGPLNIMEMVNLQGEIWTKSGTVLVSPFDLSSFFSVSPSDFISDPKILFDAQSARWFASITDITTSSVRVAVSDTSDATGRYCLYPILGSSSLLLDQPIIGVSNDKLVVSVNDFSLFSGHFKGAQFWVLNKSEMLTCSPTSFVTKKITSYFSIHPVQSLTSTSTEYMVSTSHTSLGSFVNVFSVNGVPPNPVSVSTNKLAVSSILTPPSAIQTGTSSGLDTGDYRVLDAAWANGILWLAHNNKCTPAGDSSSRSCLHLVELNTGTMQVAQDFNYGVTGKYVFYPALREIPSSGNLFLVFGFSSSTDHPGIEVTEQATTDPANSLEAPTLLQAGLAPVTLTYGCSGGICRYGDYFGAALDPSVSNGVWVAGEYGSGVLDSSGFGPAWGTKIGNFAG